MRPLDRVNPKISFVINPRAGRGTDIARLVADISDYTQRRIVYGRAHVTEHRYHARLLARDAVANGYTHVVAVGGDGTVNEVASELVGTEVVMVIVPRGSGNGLARHLGIPPDLVNALSGLEDGRGRALAIDTGTVNTRFFCNVMGIGYDAVLSRRFASLRRRGFIPYAREAWSEYLRREVLPLELRVDGQPRLRRLLMLSVANSEQYGYGARIAPGASVLDGHFDVVCVEPLSLVGALCTASRMFRGVLGPGPGIERFQVTALRVLRGGPGLIHVDGEVYNEDAELAIRARPRSLLVYIPPGLLPAAVYADGPAGGRV